jgi:hypothetical protein
MVCFEELLSSEGDHFAESACEGGYWSASVAKHATRQSFFPVNDSPDFKKGI